METIITAVTTCTSRCRPQRSWRRKRKRTARYQPLDARTGTAGDIEARSDDNPAVSYARPLRRRRMASRWRLNTADSQAKRRWRPKRAVRRLNGRDVGRISPFRQTASRGPMTRFSLPSRRTPYPCRVWPMPDRP